MPRKIVYKVEDGVDPREVYCTTYQMRNFFKQMADGFYSSLDVMNYIQHQAAVDRMRKGDRILDVCCGRGLLLPLIRWYKRDIAEYVGVDICEKNMKEQERRSGAKEIDGLEYYEFPVTHILSSCEEMTDHLEAGSFDGIVYTSAIEHMQKEVGYRSLEECFTLLKDGGWLFLSCPNTTEKKDPYDTQYAAHLYEWDLDELTSAVEKVGFHIEDTFGLVGKVRDFESYIAEQSLPEQETYHRLKKYLPTKWLMSFLPVLYPEGAAEVLLICRKGKGKPQARRYGRRSSLQKKKGFQL